MEHGIGPGGRAVERYGKLEASAPALLPAALLLLGIRLGLGLQAGWASPPWGLLVALALLGLALGGRGVLVTFGAAGLLVGASSGPGERAGGGGWRPHPDRPVAAVVRVTDHWRRYDDSWSTRVEVERIRQGTAGGLRIHTEGLDATLRVSGPEPPPPLGSRLRVRGFLRRAPPLGNVPRLPPGPWRLTVKSRRLVDRLEEPGPVARLGSGLRRPVEATLTSLEGPDGGLALPMVRALILGDASRVPKPVRQGLRRLGLAHVLAVSGLHVGLVAGLALVLGSGLPRRLRLLAAVAAVGTYVLLVGPRPSLLRASVMAGLSAAALLSERPPQAANALAVAAAGIALSEPALVVDLGFRLTVGATAGIVLLGPDLARRWSGEATGASSDAPGKSGKAGSTGWRTALLRSLAASAGAQLGVLPWALPAFCLFTPWASVANLVAVPWTAVSLVGCLVWTGVSVLAPEAGSRAVPMLEVLVTPFGWPAALPPRPWIAVPVSPGFVEAAAAAAVLWFVLRRPRRRWSTGLLVVATVSLMAAGSERAPDAVVATVLDVGQGDAILLQDRGAAVLVDGGGWPHGDLGGRVLLPTLVRRGVRRLDAVVVSHPDRDHCGGLIDVAGYLAVERAISGPGIQESSCGRSLDALPGVERRVVAAGGTLRVGRWRLRVLHPRMIAPHETADSAVRDGSNDASLVLAAEAFGRSLLLTGDVEAGGERRLLRRHGASLGADVLKVAHHGSRTSTSRRFLETVAPRVALISVGARNPYGHPAPEVISRLERKRVRIVRTDRDGMIEVRIRTDGRLFVRRPGAPKR